MCKECIILSDCIIMIIVVNLSLSDLYVVVNMEMCDDVFVCMLID